MGDRQLVIDDGVAVCSVGGATGNPETSWGMSSTSPEYPTVRSRGGLGALRVAHACALTSDRSADDPLTFSLLCTAHNPGGGVGA